MVGILVKKQMAEIFRGYFYDAKKNKKRSKISTILFILMYVHTTGTARFRHL